MKCELTIFKSDGSIYWKENFNDEDSLNKWLDDEKTRPYWEKDFTTSIETFPEPVIDTEAIEQAEISKKELILSAKNKIKLLGLSDAEIEAIFNI